MKVLVTGSQGTLGKKLVAELTSRGYEVSGCDLHHGEKNEVRADISEQRQVRRVFGSTRPDIVFHLAAEFGRMNGQEYYEQLWKTNCIGTRNIIDACAFTGAHLVFASSSEAYGDGANLGAMNEALLEKHVPQFHNEYALTKWTNEKQIQLAIRNDSLYATILRFFNAYGPGEEYTSYRSVVCLFIYRMLFNLPITVYKGYHRVFMYVDDWRHTVANVASRYATFPNGTIINIGGEEYISVEELVEKLKKLIPETRSQITLLPKENANITNKKPDISLAKKLLDHNCYINLDTGLPITVAWMRDRYGVNSKS